jgi:hypothetical protein
MKVYQYGGPRQALGREAWRQLRMAHTYYNALVEAENARRRVCWGGDAAPPPPHQRCKCDVCALYWQILRGSPLDLRPLRAAAAERGLYWGTYLVVEEDFARAVRSTPPRDLVSFRPWRAGGTIAVQVQRAAWERDQGASMFRLDPRPDHRTGRRAGHRHDVRLRIGTDASRQPVWSEPIPIELHRPLPAGGRVAWVKVHVSLRPEERTRSNPSGSTVTVSFVVDDEVAEAVAADESAVVAVDASWRLESDGRIRCAVAQDTLGCVRALHLDERWLSLSREADRQRGRLDLLHDEAVAQWPGVLRTRHWQSCDRALMRLGVLTAAQWAWRERVRHVAQIETGLRRRSVRHRRDAFRVWARRLADDYTSVVVKATNHKRLKEDARQHSGDPAGPCELPRRARRRGHHAAPGELVAWLRQIMPSVLVDAAYTTQHCQACDAPMPVDHQEPCEADTDPGPATVVICERCGAEVDRDIQSTANMLDLWRAGAGTDGAARKRAPRFAKRHANGE